MKKMPPRRPISPGARHALRGAGLGQVGAQVPAKQTSKQAPGTGYIPDVAFSEGTHQPLGPPAMSPQKAQRRIMPTQRAPRKKPGRTFPRPRQ
jgi:hypothetical protein